MKPQYNETTTIEDFLNTPEGDNNNNWLTRELSGGVRGIVDETHFQIAKEVLRRKCLVGVTSDLFTSMERMMKYFGWGSDDSASDIKNCRFHIDEDKDLDRLYVDVKEDSPEWDLIASRNQYDMRLHEFVELLFHEQGKYFSNLTTDMAHGLSTASASGVETSEPNTH